MSIINGTASEYEMPREPKFYPNDNITTPFDISNTLRYGTIRTGIRYVVKDDGIYEEYDILDQYGEEYVTSSRKVFSKDAFIEAYEKYIKTK